MEVVGLLVFLAPLFVPPIYMVRMIARRASARMEKFPKHCVTIAMCLGYLSSITSLDLSIEQWGPAAGFWYDKTIWPALLAPVLVSLALVFTLAKVFRIEFSRRIFAGACLFAYANFTAYYLFWFWLLSRDLFEEVLSLRSVLRLFDSM